MSEELFEQFKVFLPKYLTPREARELFCELEKFPNNDNFYLLSHPDELLQADGWRGLVAIDFHTLSKKVVSGVILSNSCDINPRNQGALDSRVLFCPIIRLASYTNLLLDARRNAQQIENTLSAVRLQKVTNLFYLPPYAKVMEESIIVLDDIHGHPLRDFITQDRSRLFTLNQYAFYIFVIKLSIHFTRLQENVPRFPDSGPEQVVA
jgi:hypothetical protein